MRNIRSYRHRCDRCQMDFKNEGERLRVVKGQDFCDLCHPSEDKKDKAREKKKQQGQRGIGR